MHSSTRKRKELFWDESVDAATLLKSLFHVHQQRNSVNNFLHQLHFRLAQSVKVRYIEGTADGSGVNTSCPPFL